MNTTLEQRVITANAQNRIARIPFITAGFPTKEAFVNILCELDANGADIIEIGIPFSDPVADGPVVENASRTALKNGVTLHWIMDTLKNLTPRLTAGLVLMGYYNPFLQYGLEALVRDCVKTGVQGLIVPDLPLGEDAPLRTLCRQHTMDLITLVGPNTSKERMQEYASVASGYVYVVSVMGTTGVRADMSAQAEHTLKTAKSIFTLPVALGFGIEHPSQIDAMKVKPHAAVFGSALLKHLSTGNSTRDFMIPWIKDNT